MPENTSQILAGHSTRTPERICLYLLRPEQPDQPVTYQDLYRQAAGYARAYAESGVQPGEVVIIIHEFGLDLIAAFWGAILHGAVPSIMPFLTEKLQPDRYRNDLAALVEVTLPSAIATYPEFEQEVRSAIGPLSSVRTILVSSRVQPGSISDPDKLPGWNRAADDIVFLQHSSGTTGLQKGVAITHQALLNQLAHYQEVLHLTPLDVIVSWLPLYHDMGLIAGFLMPILMGIPLVLMSPFDWVKAPYRLFKAVTDYQGTLSWLPNFAYNFCATRVRNSQLHGINLATWRAVISCSEPVHEKSLRVFAECFRPYGLPETALAASYAMAENVFAVTQGGIDSPLVVDEVDLFALQYDRWAKPAQPGRSSIKMVSCGRPIPGTSVRVVDAGGKELVERHIGEIAISSDCMLSGYYHRPDATASAFLDGWFLTGDLGYCADGEIYITGRKKDLIIIGGRNIFPQDLEALANEVSGVHPGRAVAFGIYNEQQGTEEAVLIAEVDRVPDLPEARQALEDAIRLAVYQGSEVSLRLVKLVDPQWMVKTSSGKPARSANREKFLKEQAPPEEPKP